MKVVSIVMCIALAASASAKVTKRSRTSEPEERQLMDSADNMMEVNDTNAINNADARMISLVNAVNRLKNKLQRELQTTVSYLRYHFNQRDVFDKRIMMHALANKGAGASLNRERRLDDQQMLKDYGKIDASAKEEAFEVVKVPAEAASVADIAKVADAGDALIDKN